MMREMWKEAEKGEKLEKIRVMEEGWRTFHSNLVRLPGRLRALQDQGS